MEICLIGNFFLKVHEMTMMIHDGIYTVHPHLVLMNIFFAMNFQLFKQSTYIPVVSICIDENTAVPTL